MIFMAFSSQLFNQISMAAATIVSLFLAIVVIKLILNKKLKEKVGYYNKKKKKYHPIGGTIFNQLMNFNRLHHYMTDLARRHKTYRLLSPFRNEIYTSDPANVEYMLKTNFQNYGKGRYNYSILRDLLGDGIFTVDGERWRDQRKVASYEFSTKVLRDFSSVVFRKNAVKLANILSEAADCNRIVDIQDMFMKSTLDSIFKVSFGVELDTVSGASEEFSLAFDDASALTLWRYVDIFWKVKKALGIGSEAKLKARVKLVDEFVLNLIRSKMSEASKEAEAEDDHQKRDDILSRFLRVTEEADPKYLRDIILNFIIAGKDTTATTLAWLVYMLCRHPPVQERVAEEIREATGTKDSTSIVEFAGSLSEEALDKMQYLQAAITETLRLYPAVPVDAKICMADDRLPDGFNVRKGDMVSYQPYAMGRMKFIWGEDAEDFRPERWLDDKGCFQPQSPFKFTAFQAGPRMCLGKEFAYRQMKIFSAVLLKHFAFRLGDEEKEVNYRTMINLHIDGGLHVQPLHR